MTDMRTPGPTRTPPQNVVSDVGAEVGTSRPEELTDDQLRAMVSGTAATAVGRPTLMPPGAARATGAKAAGAVTATWRSGVTITALWTIDETRNAFAHVDGVGWKKLYNGRDGAFAALVTLAAQARQTGRTVNLREEADGMIYEIYLW